MATAKRVTLARDTGQVSERIKWFTYVDVLIAHGLNFSKRDCALVGRLLKISTFSMDMGTPFGDVPYINSDGTLRTERYQDWQTQWFTEKHLEVTKALTLRYLDASKTHMPLAAYALCLYFLQNADERGRFVSKWKHVRHGALTFAEHESGMPVRTVRNMITWLLKFDVIQRVSKGLSSYQFKS